MVDGGVPGPAWRPTPMLLRPSASACAAARAVAPVVRMSSISRTCLPVTAAGSETVKAPRTFRRRWRGVSPAWLSVARRRISVLGASVSRHSGCDLAQRTRARARPGPGLVESALACAWSGAAAREPPASRPAPRRQAGRWRGPAIAPKPAGGGMQPVVLEGMDGGLHAALVESVRDRAHKGRRRQAAGAAEMRGTLPVRPERQVERSRRSGRTRGRSGRKFQSSKHHKLARKRSCGRGEPQRVQEAGRRAQPRRPWDFGARGPRRANGKSPMAERRTSVNRSPCGRRTSLLPGRPSGRSAAAALPISIAFMQMFSK